MVDNVKMGMKQRARTGKWNGGIVRGYKSVIALLRLFCLLLKHS